MAKDVLPSKLLHFHEEITMCGAGTYAMNVSGEYKTFSFKFSVKNNI